MGSSGDARGSGKGLFPMRVVEDLTGLSRRQVRYYEQQGLLRPERSEGGHRLYSPEDVERLTLIKSLMAKGFTTIESVKRCLSSHLRLSAKGRGAPAGTPAEASLLHRQRPATESDADSYFGRHKLWANRDR